jgi:hypothetical protein
MIVHLGSKEEVIAKLAGWNITHHMHKSPSPPNPINQTSRRRI